MANLSNNPRFSMLEFARENSPRGQDLLKEITWTSGTGASSVPIILQPPTSVGNGEMFFIKRINVLIKSGTSFGSNKFQITHNSYSPTVLYEATTVIQLHNLFDVDSVSPLQNPQYPTDTTEVYNKLVMEFPVPIQIRSSKSDKLEVKLVDTVNVTTTTGLPTGLMTVATVGWRILEASF